MYMHTVVQSWLSVTDSVHSSAVVCTHTQVCKGHLWQFSMEGLRPRNNSLGGTRRQTRPMSKVKFVFLSHHKLKMSHFKKRNTLFVK